MIRSDTARTVVRPYNQQLTPHFGTCLGVYEITAQIGEGRDGHTLTSHLGLPRGTRLGIAFSGGLDTRCAVAWLSENGMKVYAYTADLAQPDEADPATIPP